MTSVPDPYREWDAAYVLGSLSPGERHEYEEHLSTCTACSTDVAELAGVAGVLRAVPHDRAMALLEVDAGSGASEAGLGQVTPMPPMPPDMLPNFLRIAGRSQSRARARTISWIAGGVAAAAAAIMVVALAFGLNGTPNDGGRHVTMTQTAPGPITADATLTEQPWGTTIELECAYALDYGGLPMLEAARYGLYVIDRAGNVSEQATWEAAPGSTVTPTATTALPIGEILRIEIRWLDSGRVILEATP